MDFFRRAVAVQKECARSGLRIVSDQQTNGVLLDGERAAFPKEHRFLLRLSIVRAEHATRTRTAANFRRAKTDRGHPMTGPVRLTKP